MVQNFLSSFSIFNFKNLTQWSVDAHSKACRTNTRVVHFKSLNFHVIQTPVCSTRAEPLSVDTDKMFQVWKHLLGSTDSVYLEIVIERDHC